MSPLLISHNTVARQLSRIRFSTFAAKHILFLVAILLPLLAPCASSAQPAPAVYTWSWNPADALVRTEAQVFVDESNCSNICFQNPNVPPWPDPMCGPPNPIPNFWNWSILPPVPPPAPAVPRNVPPLDWDEQQGGPPGFELGTIFIGPYCPCPSSDAMGNPPPPTPLECGLDWSQRVAYQVPIGLTFHNMYGHPSLQPEYQLTNDVFASDGDVPWATVFCFNAPFVPPLVEVTGFADQVVTARGQRGLIGGVQSFGTRTWELRSTNEVDLFSFYPPGADRYVAEGCGTIVTQTPMEINGLTPGLPFRYTLEFQTLGEAASAKDSHPYLDPLFNLFIRPDADNAYAIAQIKVYDNGNWGTNFIEYAGDAPLVPSPPISVGQGGVTYLPTPISNTYPVVVRMTSRVRGFIEDLPDPLLEDSAVASMKTNIFLTVFGPPVVGEFVPVPGGGEGPAYDFWMGKYEISNAEYVDFLNDAQQDSESISPSAKSAFMVFDASTGDVSLADGTMLFSPIQAPVPAPALTLGPKIRYRPFMDAGTRYVVESSAEPDPVVGVSWLGAVKYCNWLTLYMGYGIGEQCYNEGPNANDWHPVTIAHADWQTRDLDAAERAALAANFRGFRLPMDNLGTATGYISNQQNAFNEWYKAMAYDPSAPPAPRIGPGGETVPAFHWIYGFGRDSIGDVDANYLTSGDRFETGAAHIGHYDGVNTLANGVSTVDTSNPWGMYDLAGNVNEWSQDKGVGNGGVDDRYLRTGSWNDAAGETAASRRIGANVGELSTTVGFRVLSTFQPQGVPVPPPNDLCANAGFVLLTPGAFAFDSTGALTDGPAEPCGFTGIPNQDADLWFQYIAPSCSGMATLTLTSAMPGGPDQLLAAYNDCPLAGGVLIACGSGPAAGITFPTVAGQLYWIRTGSVGGITGVSTLQLDFSSNCTADIAPPGGDCAVGVPDLLAIINAWGPCPGCPQDVAPPGGDGTVGVPDLLAVINAWGPCP